MSPALCGAFLFYNWSVFALPNKLKNLTYISELLEESWIPYKVDLVELSKVNKDFREKILKEAVLWVG